MTIHRRQGFASELAALLALSLLASPLFGLTLEELRREPKLTPQRLARHFANFKFEFHAQVQSPEAFLASEAGDCDDFATLAATVLREKGYTTRLVTVRLPGIVHVVCYVAETRCYLDYNNREFLIRTVSSDGSLKDIAHRVASSFSEPWISASEFTFENGLKQTLITVAHQGKTLPTQLATRQVHDIPIDF